MGRFGLPALFSFLTLAFAVIAYAGASHGKWPIAVGAAGIALWMATFAWSAIRRMRR